MTADLSPPPASYKSSPAFAGPLVDKPQWVQSFLVRVLYRAYSTLHFALWFALLVVVDALLLTPLNAVLRPLPAGHVVPPAFSPTSPPPFKQRPVTACVCWLARALPGRLTPEWVAAWSEWSGVGSGGEWGEARAPDHAVDSRCPCPALNALANHGLIPHDGRRIRPSQLAAALARAYNLSPTIAYQLLAPMYQIWEGRGWFDLHDIAVPGLVAHDGSFTREDMHSPWAHHNPLVNQATPSARLVDLYFPPGAPPYSLANFSCILFHARATSRSLNGQFLLSPLQLFFGSGNAALALAVVGGEVGRLRDWFGADGFERFPAGWEPECKSSLGMNISAAQAATWQVELGCGRVGGPRMTGWATSEDGWKLVMEEKKKEQ